jgi:hypothetical protein
MLTRHRPSDWLEALTNSTGTGKTWIGDGRHGRIPETRQAAAKGIIQQLDKSSTIPKLD